MTAAQEKASELQQQQQQAPREWVPDGRKIYDDILPTLAFKTVKSWADTRVGDNRKTSVYHLAAYIRLGVEGPLPVSGVAPPGSQRPEGLLHVEPAGGPEHLVNYGLLCQGLGLET